ncbi:uncharacterized protein H6S33_010210 [Morchella sextelata]|uniref:uncharacterized protein n=1 Tax=Morchella sextelata TaxID=1174677 RepID=UPI001D04B8E4|nr:uncharacterized protein H6S33_010210 [Morchella sextelata]KAH0612158.1 hypothetical protein H6S33_010210 [Morchella sextelata]
MVRAGIKEAHPAGIWSDLSIDGPVIGTLIVVLDKAKNLPNRKKIGKQDPYAVARLGKEGKRTDTDVRGGQTPRWDKELRFPVRNSPDYRKLKITVFNDDKKTDLIGECSIRLDKILVTGGGTDDGWRGLKCKDKYAGEILVELTFWDMRPTPETQKRTDETSVVKQREVEERRRDPMRKLGGAREMGSRERIPKRRPLPSDPSLSREDLSLPSQQSQEPARATRRSRHSHHPQVHQSHHSDPRAHHREMRGSRPISFPNNRGGIAMTPAAVNPGNEIYDPYGQHDSYIPGMDMLGQYDEPDVRNGHQTPPPPPPLHSRSYQGDGRHHSATNIATQLVLPSQQQSQQGNVSGHRRQKSLLRHYQSVPDWQYYQQNNPIDSPEMQFDQYGGSYPGPQNEFPPQQGFEEYDDRPAPSPNTHHNRRSRHQEYNGIRPEDEIPGLSFGSTPTSSQASLRNNDDPPPPPPPPHARKPAPTRMEEPDWQVKPLRSFMEQSTPAYDDAHAQMAAFGLEERAPSRGRDIPPSRNGVPIPPSLVPGFVPEEETERVARERRLSFNEAASAEVAALLHLNASTPHMGGQMQHVSSKNYHRPQVEEVQDVALYQPQLLPEDQVIERTKKQRPAPMVKPMPIHGERNAGAMAEATTSISKRNSMMVAPERKPVPPPSPKPLEGLPFSPDSFNIINPGPAVQAESKKPKKMISPGTNRVLDATDILPPESFAPEPELKKRSPRPPPQVPANHRKERVLRSLSPLPPKKAERLALPPPPPSVPKREFVNPNDSAVEAPRDRERERKKKLRNSLSMALVPSNSSGSRQEGTSRNRHSMVPGAMVMYNPQSEREQRRQDMDRNRDSRALVPSKGYENYGYEEPRYTGMEVASYAPTSRASRAPTSGPPIPAKIPIPGGNGQLSREDYLLSQEMSMINIGSTNLGRTRRRY